MTKARQGGDIGGHAHGTIMLVDDDPAQCELLRRWLEDEGFNVMTYHDGQSCLAGLTEVLPDAVCLDLVMPGLDGFETMRRIRAHHPRLPITVMTAQTGVASVVEAMKLGAYDYLVKPVERTKLTTELRNAVEHNRMSTRLAQLEREVQGIGYPGIVGESPPMQDLFRRIDRIAASDITVLVHGDSGTGKELVARAIHGASSRHRKPFVPLSCAAIPESLQESELFGHERGAFTGATSRRIGCFERSNGGTLLLDEIGELSRSTQAKLLRVLQERCFQRVGGNSEIHSNFRLIAATNRDLAEEVREGRFREDLYFRVVVMELNIPPLRERERDVVLLARHFLREYGGDRGPADLAPETVELLLSYDWPGNVRELQNAMERAVVEAGGDLLTIKDLPVRIRRGPNAASGESAATTGLSAYASSLTGDGARSGLTSKPMTLDELEREAIVQSLARNEGNISRVVRELGIGRTTLYRKLQRYNLR